MDFKYRESRNRVLELPKLAIAQLSMSEDIRENVRETVFAMETAASKMADLILFPEAQLSPFFPQYPDSDARPYLLDIDGEIIQAIRKKCRQLNLMGSFNFYLSEDLRTYDASILVDKSGDILSVSKMVHVTQAAQFYEQNYYTPSNDGFMVKETEAGKIGTVICFDRHYPESIRSCTLQGADFILIPTANMIGEPLEMFEWELRVAAFHNSVYIAMCNRVGTEGAAEYCGRSILVNPNGEVVFRADDEEGITCADLDLTFVADTRMNNKYLELYRQENFDLSGC